jgi:hypothetical protein
VDARVLVGADVLLGDWRVLHDNARPVGAELVGKDRRQRGRDALADLGLREQQGDAIVGGDADPGREGQGGGRLRRRAARGRRKLQAQHQCTGAAQHIASVEFGE